MSSLFIVFICVILFLFRFHFTRCFILFNLYIFKRSDTFSRLGSFKRLQWASGTHEVSGADQHTGATKQGTALLLGLHEAHTVRVCMTCFANY
ncbi:hypothetical protein E2C01_060017 [Portunus trituberculatus]|uniref:Uncharacterized protein n=1 Tax=Portunus trituberculatus TaxID=210409 RepID=A0A5B7H7R1_PORTR|nr:hypothetical protein [Portunus trituberculatus]